MKQISIFTFFLLLYSLLPAQKVAVCGFSSSSPDGFSFVALTDLASSDVIYFTDGPYDNSTDGFDLASASDVVLQFTPPVGGITKGDVIFVTETAANTLSLSRSGGSPTGAMVILESGSRSFDLVDREPIFSFEASNLASPATTVTELYSRLVIGGTGTPDSGDDPASDVDIKKSANYTSIVFNGNGLQNGEYDPASRSNVNSADFENAANWNTSGSSITLSTTAFGISFPVEWLSFSAEPIGGKVVLSWTTGSELNNDYFAVERSLDGIMYENLGQVVGSGTSQIKQNYRFADDAPFAGRGYYRIRQVDLDGAFDFSAVLTVEYAIDNLKVRAYPNPIVDQLYVESPGGNLLICNMMGQEVAQYPLATGYNVLNLKTLESGQYIGRIVYENQLLGVFQLLK